MFPQAALSNEDIWIRIEGKHEISYIGFSTYFSALILLRESSAEARAGHRGWGLGETLYTHAVEQRPLGGTPGEDTEAEPKPLARHLPIARWCRPAVWIRRGAARRVRLFSGHENPSLDQLQ